MMVFSLNSFGGPIALPSPYSRTASRNSTIVQELFSETQVINARHVLAVQEVEKDQLFFEVQQEKSQESASLFPTWER
jgi:hypothetical protein